MRRQRPDENGQKQSNRDPSLALQSVSLSMSQTRLFQAVAIKRCKLKLNVDKIQMFSLFAIKSSVSIQSRVTNFRFAKGAKEHPYE